MAETPQKFLRPAGGDALLPNSYLFCGEITAYDRYLHEGDPEPSGSRFGHEWRVHFVVDCGPPLNFRVGLEPGDRGVPHFKAEDVETGVYVAGLAELGESGDSGLYQPIAATLMRMKVLSLDPEEEWFGTIRDVPYGYRLRLDPDTIAQPFVFMDVEVDEIHPVQYQPFPARSARCPHPVL